MTHLGLPGLKLWRVEVRSGDMPSSTSLVLGLGACATAF